MLWSLSSGNHKVEAWVLLWFYLFSLLISVWEVEREICTLRERWLILLLCRLETVPVFIWLYTWKTQKSQLKNYYRQKENWGTSLVVQWLMQGVFRGTSVLPMQGVGVWFLLRELDPTYCNQELGAANKNLFLKENSVILCTIKLINRNPYVQKAWKIWRARIKIR